MSTRRPYVSFFSLLVLPMFLLAYDWNIEVIDAPIWTFAFGTSITIDDSARVHVAYDRGTSEDDVVLRHGVWDYGTYSAETVDSTAGAGIDNDITIDSFGRIHIVYCRSVDIWSFNTDLYYAYYDGNWHREPLDTLGVFAGYCCNIRVDQDNYPHIAALTGNMNPTYLYYNGSNWQSQIIPDLVETDDMVLDNLDHPIVSNQGSSQNCMVTFYDGANWHPDTVDPNSPCYTNSMALDTFGYPHIAYRYLDGANCLKYGYFDGATWHTEVVDNNGNTGIDPSIAIDGNNCPHISYYSITESCLKLARWNGSSWEIEVVDNDGDVGRQSALIMDTDNYPYIIYEDNTNLAVKLAYVTQSIVDERRESERIHSEVIIHPNPFYGATTISTAEKPISLKIYSQSGRLVRDLVPISGSLVWNGRDNDGIRVQNGVYFLRMVFKEKKINKKIIFLGKNIDHQ